MSARNNVVMTFHSNVGEVVSLTIPRADQNLTEPRVRTTMEGIIDGGIVITSGGIPTAIRSAQIVSTTRTPLASV